jgi:hypothetical protein
MLSIPKSVPTRLAAADGTDFSNLTICGDWTLCRLNVGCVLEATVTSGLLAFLAMKVTGEHDFPWQE